LNHRKAKKAEPSGFLESLQQTFKFQLLFFIQLQISTIQPRAA